MIREGEALPVGVEALAVGLFVADPADDRHVGAGLRKRWTEPVLDVEENQDVRSQAEVVPQERWGIRRRLAMPSSLAHLVPDLPD